MNIAARAATPVLMVPLLVSCDALDRLLESSAGPAGYLSIEWPVDDAALLAGERDTLTVAITRLNGYGRAVSVSAVDLPSGASASVSMMSSGSLVTAEVELTASPSMTSGEYSFRLRVRGERLRDTTEVVTLRVLEPPSYAVAVEPAVVPVIRSGVAPVVVRLARANFVEPVTLAFQSAAGITATLDPNPISGDSALAQVAVSNDVTPGTYDVLLAGTPASGTATLRVVVLEDDIQVITASSATTRQGRTARQNVRINLRPGVALQDVAAEGLPDGITAILSPTGANEYELALTVSPAASPGNHPVTVRARAAGVQDATAELLLRVEPSSVHVNAHPRQVSLFQGMRAVGMVQLTRAFLDTTVAFSLENRPAGVTFSAEPADDDASAFEILASATTPPGDYQVVIVATPFGWPPASGARDTIAMTVHAAPQGEGNVILDWTACGAPAWAAIRDGDGAWTALEFAGDAATVAIARERAGIAFVDDGVLNVRYRSRDELTDFPEVMCEGPPNIAQVSGSAVHRTANEVFRYGYGGGTATSTAESPAFTIAGVAPGTHDLVVWGTRTPTGTRGLIRRGIPVNAFASLGPIDLLAPESFAPASASLVASAEDESLDYAMELLTGPGCTVNPLDAGAFGGGTTIFGVPADHLRQGDFHHVSVRFRRGSQRREVRASSTNLVSRIVSPPSAVNVSITSLPGTYRRLRLGASVPPAYNTETTFIYTAGGRRAILSESFGYRSGTADALIELPDFSSVAGWQDAYAPSFDGAAAWEAEFSGGSRDSPCSDGYRRVSARYTGSVVE